MVIHFSMRQSEDTGTQGGAGYEKRHRKGGNHEVRVRGLVTY